MILATASAASRVLSNNAAIVCGCWALGRSISVASVITPSVPSLPTNNRVRS